VKNEKKNSPSSSEKYDLTDLIFPKKWTQSRAFGDGESWQGSKLCRSIPNAVGENKARLLQ
jgi:hypothetical protein